MIDDNNNPVCKLGDTLQLVWIADGESILSNTEGGYYNHYIGDIGTVIEMSRGFSGQLSPLVHVEGRIGTGCAGNTIWDQHTRFINITRQLKIDSVLGL